MDRFVPHNGSYLYSRPLVSVETPLRALVFVIIIAWSAVGNSMVIVAVYKDQRLHTITNYFICSLAVADLLVALLIMPMASLLHLMGSWVFGALSCTMWTSGDILCCTASILMLTAISLDRYWAVSQPVEYRDKMTDRRCAVIIAFIWIFSTILAIAQILWRLIIESEFDMRACNYTLNKEFRIVSSMSSFFVPLSIMMFAYVKIFSIVFKPSNMSLAPLSGVENLATKDSENTIQTKSGREDTDDTLRPLVPGVIGHVINGDSLTRNDWSENMNKCQNYMSSTLNMRESTQSLHLKKEEIITARLVGIVIACFVVCWLPFFTLYVLEAFCTSCEYSAQVSLVFLWLGYINSALNPIIYIIFDKQHRDVYKLLGRIVISCVLDNLISYQISPVKESKDTSLNGNVSSDAPPDRMNPMFKSHQIETLHQNGKFLVPEKVVVPKHSTGKRHSIGYLSSETLQPFSTTSGLKIEYPDTPKSLKHHPMTYGTPSTSQARRKPIISQQGNNLHHFPNFYSQTSINLGRNGSQTVTPLSNNRRKRGNSESKETQKRSLEQQGFKTATLLTIEPLAGSGPNNNSDFSSLEELEMIEASSGKQIASHSPIISQV